MIQLVKPGFSWQRVRPVILVTTISSVKVSKGVPFGMSICHFEYSLSSFLEYSIIAGCRTCTRSTISSTKGQHGWPLTTSRNKYKPAERDSYPMQQCCPKYIGTTEIYIQENSSFGIFVYIGRLKAKGERRLGKEIIRQHREYWHSHGFVSVAPSTGSRGAKRRLSRLGAAVAPTTGPWWAGARSG